MATRGKRRRRSRQALSVAARPEPSSTTTASGRAVSASVRARRSSPGVPTDCMPAVSLIMLTSPRRRTGASARRSTRVTPRAVLAIGADTTDSVSTPGTCTISIGRVKRLLEHFPDNFSTGIRDDAMALSRVTRATPEGDPHAGMRRRPRRSDGAGRAAVSRRSGAGRPPARRSTGSAAPARARQGATGTPSPCAASTPDGPAAAASVPWMSGESEQAEPAQRPDDHRRLADDVVHPDRCREYWSLDVRPRSPPRPSGGRPSPTAAPRGRSPARTAALSSGVSSKM